MTLPLTSPFTSGTAVTKAQLDQLVTAINTLYSSTASGTASGTTDASGYATITHGLSFTPSYVQAVSTQGGNSLANIAFPITVDTIGATTFRVRFMHASTLSGSDWLVNLAVSLAFAIKWSALK